MDQKHSGKFTPTKDDAIQSYKVLWTSYLMRPTSVISTIVLTVIGTVLLLMAFYGRIPPWIIYTAVGIGVPLTLVLVILVLAPMEARKHFRQLSHLQDEVRFELDESGISFETDRGNAHYQWSDFHRWVLTKNHLLLFLSDAVSMIVPRRALSESEDVAVSGLNQAGVKRA